MGVGIKRKYSYEQQSYNKIERYMIQDAEVYIDKYILVFCATGKATIYRMSGRHFRRQDNGRGV